MQVYGHRLVAGNIWAAYRYEYRPIGDRPLLLASFSGVAGRASALQHEGS
jgi:hypothetical protein